MGDAFFKFPAAGNLGSFPSRDCFCVSDSSSDHLQALMRIFPFFLHRLFFDFFHQPKCPGASRSLGGRNKSLRESAIVLFNAQDCEECAGKVEILRTVGSNIRKTGFKISEEMVGVKGWTSGCILQ